MTVMNGNQPNRPLIPGVYASVPAFYHPTSEDLDIPTFQSHIIRIANASIGIVVCGSTSEVLYADPFERLELVRAARAALNNTDFTARPIIAGISTGSTRETIKFAEDVAKAGADYALMIPNGYLAGSLDRKALKGFFRDVAQASPIPVMVYNSSMSTGGINMDSDLIEEIAMEIPNLCAVVLACGNIGKLTRIAATVNKPSFTTNYPRKNNDAPFLVLSGSADSILPSTFVGGHGAISGLATVYPHALRALWASSITSLPSTSPGSPSAANLAQSLTKCMHIQDIVAHADQTITAAGGSGVKILLKQRFGHGDVNRLPLRLLEDNTQETLKTHQHVLAMEDLEKDLEAERSLESEKRMESEKRIESEKRVEMEKRTETEKRMETERSLEMEDVKAVLILPIESSNVAGIPVSNLD